MLGASPQLRLVAGHSSELGRLPEVVRYGVIGSAAEVAPGELGPVQQQPAHPAAHGGDELVECWTLVVAGCGMVAQGAREGGDGGVADGVEALVEAVRAEPIASAVPVAFLVRLELGWRGAVAEPAVLLASLILPAHRASLGCDGEQGWVSQPRGQSGCASCVRFGAVGPCRMMLCSHMLSEQGRDVTGPAK